MQHEKILVAYSEAQRTGALKRFFLLRPFLEDGVSLTHVATEHQIPVRTLRRWGKQYQKQGLDGLIRQERKDKGKKQVVSPQMQHLIEGLSLQRPQRTIAHIQREVERVAKERGNACQEYVAQDAEMGRPGGGGQRRGGVLFRFGTW